MAVAARAEDARSAPPLPSDQQGTGMASPFNMPDEFVQGFFKSGQSLLKAFGGGHGGSPSGAWHAPALPLAPLQMQAQTRYWEQQMTLWSGILTGASGPGREPVVASERGDRRFHADAWRDNPWYSLLKQTCLLNSRLLSDMVESAELEERDKHNLRFYARQFIDSMSPANFAATNPDVLKLALKSNGQSVRAGIANLLEDLRKGRISITDEAAFEVGRNVAASTGSVVFENKLFQLIQYAPLTDQVATRPLLIVPPCINKFYILDLQPENSFVRFACEQGLTVFLVSWRNPGADMDGTTWDDYLEQGAMKAIAVALAISKADKVNALGWCVGGTILSSALAVLRARRQIGGQPDAADHHARLPRARRPGRVHRRAGCGQARAGDRPGRHLPRPGTRHSVPDPAGQ